MNKGGNFPFYLLTASKEKRKGGNREEEEDEEKRRRIRGRRRGGRLGFGVLEEELLGFRFLWMIGRRRCCPVVPCGNHSRTH